MYRSGLTNLLDKEYGMLEGKSVGLVTNHSGLTEDLRRGPELLRHHPGIELGALFGPEHGLSGSVSDGKEIGDSTDPRTGLPVYSLYGENMKPTPDQLEGLDLLVFDIQDVGVRYFTYISTLFCCMEACAERGLPMVILDRLNPLGRRVEGNILDPDFASFVGYLPLPTRHGMTVGELALWARGERGLDVELEVVRLTGWRGEYFDELDLLWVPPSPNIPHFTTALIYVVSCMFEGTTLSEGRGTPNPFEFIGAPGVDPWNLAEAVRDRDPTGLTVRPVFFHPQTSWHRGEECGGLQLFVSSREEIDSYLAGLTVLKTILVLHPDEAGWRESGDGFFFDLLMGTDEVRRALMEGAEPEDIVTGWREEREEFEAARGDYLLY